ncbi:MAG: hypothetical protein AB9844_08625 [Clostridiaceae bacterium]
MIHVFCNKRGSGKTRVLIEMANKKAEEMKGHVVFINNNEKPLLLLDKAIRFANTGGFDLKTGNSFYGFLCGIIAEDYDIDNIFIDHLFNIVDMEIKDAEGLFQQFEKFSNKHNVDLYINVTDDDGVPEFMKKYIV